MVFGPIARYPPPVFVIQHLEQNVSDLLLNFSFENFQRHALSLFTHQYETIGLYRTLCLRQGRTPKNVQRFQDVPLLSTHAHKKHRIASFPKDPHEVVFLTSGTTRTHAGNHFMGSTRTYDLSCIQSFERLTAGFPKNGRCLSLIPSSFDLPHSSLAHMTHVLAKHLSTHPLIQGFRNGSIQHEEVLAELRTSEETSTPLFLMSTTSALCDFFEELEHKQISFHLPKGSCLFETGGKKGRRGLRPPSERVTCSQTFLGIPQEFHWAEYGMTEMSSPSWGTFKNGTFVYASPPWAPWRILHPETLQEVSVGEEGLLSFFDSANIYSVAALCVGDWARHHGDHFEVIDRAVESEFRGCSQLTPPPQNLSRPSSSLLEKINQAKKELRSSHDVSFKQACDALGSLAKQWANPEFPSRIKFESELNASNFFSPASVTAGLNRTFRALLPDRLWDAGKRAWHFGRPEKAPGLTLHIPAGNLPVTGVFSFFATALASAPTIHRPSQRGGRLLHFLHEDLQKLDPLVAERMKILDTPSTHHNLTQELLKDVSILMVQGDRTTLEGFEQLGPHSMKFLPYRPAFSLGMIPETHETSAPEMDSFLQDLFIWEQQGCLSPQILFLIGFSETRARDFIQQLHLVAEERARVWKRVPQNRNLATLRWHLFERDLDPEQNGIVSTTENLTTIYGETWNKDWFSTPGLLQVVQAKSLETFLESLLPFSGEISSIALPKEFLEQSLVGKILSTLSLQRITEMGTLQAPEFRWPQDFHDRLRSLRPSD